MCLYPKLIINPKYKINKKNGGNIPPIQDPRVTAVPIGCGRCIECVKKKGREWQTRLYEHIKANKNGIFVTLTFSNESIKDIIKLKKLENIKGYALDNAIATFAVRLWLERWRKRFKKSLNHWLITELGHNGTENIHLHGIVWTNEGLEAIRETWKYGYIWPRENSQQATWVGDATINYITKYITKQDFDHKEYVPKILTSPGIGKSYIETAKKKKMNIITRLKQRITTEQTRDTK